MLKNYKKKLLYSFSLIKEGKLKLVWNALVRRINSEELAFGFKRDLNVKISKPRSLAKISIREAKEEDDHFFLDDSSDGRIKNFHTCYVAEDKNNIPCSRLWLIDSSQNTKLKSAWGNNFPQLKNDEILLEKVFTVPKYRGLGIFPIFLHTVSNKGLKMGANYAIGFGAVLNKNTSCSFRFAGFEPYILRRVRWFMFKKKTSYEVIPDYLLDDYKVYSKRYAPKMIND